MFEDPTGEVSNRCILPQTRKLHDRTVAPVHFSLRRNVYVVLPSPPFWQLLPSKTSRCTHALVRNSAVLPSLQTHKLIRSTKYCASARCFTGVSLAHGGAGERSPQRYGQLRLERRTPAHPHAPRLRTVRETRIDLQRSKRASPPVVVPEWQPFIRIVALAFHCLHLGLVAFKACVVLTHAPHPHPHTGPRRA